LTSDLTSVFALLSKRDIKPIVARRFPLEQAPKPSDWPKTGTITGKIVLEPGRVL
jgi:NADPH:quinone reductase-like Zn-dependent oxidoreductase